MSEVVASTETSTATAEAPVADTSAVDTSTALGGDVVATEGAAEGEAEVAQTPEEIAAAETAQAEADAAAEAAKVPETYELTAPEGMVVDPADLEAATPVFKELGLNNEQASKLLPVAAKFAERLGADFNQRLNDTVNAERKSWLDTAKADPDIGGKNWDASMTTSAMALDRLGFPAGSEFRTLLNSSGLGNHPDMIRAFVAVGKAIGEDSDFVRTGQTGATVKSLASTLYGKN